MRVDQQADGATCPRVRHHLLLDLPLRTEEIALYVFLQCVSDAEGLSFYSEERICENLHFSLNGLWKAREGLVAGGFLLYSRPIYQLLDLPEPPRGA